MCLSLSSHFFHRSRCRVLNTGWHNSEGFHRPSSLWKVAHPPVCVTAPALGLYHHTARVLRHPTSFDRSGPILLLGQTLPLLADALYPRTLSVFFPAMWIPKKILPNRSRRALPNAPRTFPLFESQSNHNFVGEPHGGRQLCGPEMRLLGLTSLGLTTYL